MWKQSMFCKFYQFYNNCVFHSLQLRTQHITSAERDLFRVLCTSHYSHLLGMWQKLTFRVWFTQNMLKLLTTLIFSKKATSWLWGETYKWRLYKLVHIRLFPNGAFFLPVDILFKVHWSQWKTMYWFQWIPVQVLISNLPWNHTVKYIWGFEEIKNIWEKKMLLSLHGFLFSWIFS